MNQIYESIINAETLENTFFTKSSQNPKKLKTTNKALKIKMLQTQLIENQIMQANIKRIAFTSDGKRKSNIITLRNLLPDNLLENNFVSLQSQRISSSGRPSTMYCDRIRKQLYPQATRTRQHIQPRNLQSKQQNKLTRNKSQSSKQIMRSQSHAHGQQIQIRAQITPSNQLYVSKQQKLRMKKLLGKINLLAIKAIKVSAQEQLDVIFKFMDCLATQQPKLLPIKFCLPKPETTKQSLDAEMQVNLRKVAQISNNPKISSSIYTSSSQQRRTYKQLMEEFIQQILSVQQSLRLSQQQCRGRLQGFEALLSQKQALIAKLTSKLNFYLSHPSQNKYPQLLQLQQSNQLLKEQIQQFIYRIRVLEHNLQLLHQTKLMNENKIQELKRAISNYELQKLSNVTRVEKSSQIKNFEDNVTMLKQMLDRSIIRMSGMKEEYDKLKDHNQTLVDQRHKLARRAAVGFGELTPRPNLNRIFESHNMNYNQVFNSQQQKNTNPSKKTDKKKVSTQDFVSTLIGKFKGYYQTYKVQEKQRQAFGNYQLNKKRRKEQKYKQKQKQHQQLQQKDIFQSVMDEVYQTKNQMNKTLQAVQQVKLAYNKKQQDLLKK